MGMSIDEVIERFESNAEYERAYGNLQGCLEFRRLAEWLTELKKLREQSKWIPVSKRLPELNKPLLVTTYHRVYYGHLISESGNYGYPVFRIHGLGDKNRNWVQETMSHEPYSLRRIDAWMYLDIPEPYKVPEIPTGSDPQESEVSNG